MSSVSELRATGQPRNLVFARHETFHPRFGWLKKGFDRARQDQTADPPSNSFLADDGPVRLGVGKNMVRSLRYWCRAFKLIDAQDQPTDFGRQLLQDDGYDPYLEDPASLWLLHWKLLEDCDDAPQWATAWSLVFKQFTGTEFTAEDLVDFLRRAVQQFDRKKISDSSLRKDVSCLLRMYAMQPITPKNKGEDSLDCPFTALGLIDGAGDGRLYGFRIGDKPTLPPEIIVYACLCYVSQRETAKTTPLSALVYGEESPGMAFKLREETVSRAIAHLSKTEPSLGIDDGAGTLSFSFGDDPQGQADRILERYYSVR